MRRTSALIVGGGPAGASAAIALARGGAMPVLIERAPAARDVVCGGFLGWDAIAHLRRLGLDPAALGARPIRRLRLVHRARAVEVDLPHEAAGLSRRRLDAVLLQLAEEAGATVLRGRAARALEGRRLRLDDGEELEGEALLLATGKHELRGAARDLKGRDISVGLRAALPPIAALAGTIEMHLFEGGYAGLLVLEDGAVNLCLTAGRARMAEGAEALLASIMAEAPQLAERIGTPPSAWEAVAGVPYGWRTAATAPGLFRLGDQAAVIASLVGDGIAIALASGQAAAHACLNGDGAPAYQRAFAAKAARPVRLAEWLRRMPRGLTMKLTGMPGLARWAARLTRIG